MRISDNRYNRDRARFDLALRMMGHEARTCTIKLWTGLSEDRIRKLYKSYQPHGPRSRYRGKSPRQPVYFLQTATLCFEATTLASLLHTAGLVTMQTRPLQQTGIPLSLERAGAFCEAYETYSRLCPNSRFSFEHAWFLLVSLLKNEHIQLSHCRQCGRVYLAEPQRLQAPSCGCGSRCLGWPRRGRLPKSLIQAYDEWLTPTILLTGGQGTAPALQSG